MQNVKIGAGRYRVATHNCSAFLNSMTVVTTPTVPIPLAERRAPLQLVAPPSIIAPTGVEAMKWTLTRQCTETSSQPLCTGSTHPRILHAPTVPTFTPYNNRPGSALIPFPNIRGI